MLSLQHMKNAGKNVHASSFKPLGSPTDNLGRGNVLGSEACHAGCVQTSKQITSKHVTKRLLVLFCSTERPFTVNNTKHDLLNVTKQEIEAIYYSEP